MRHKKPNMLEQKSHVGMAQCFFCQKDSTILLDRRLKNSLPHRVGIIDMRPCNECVDWMKQGIILISISNDTTEKDMQGPIPNPYRTGGWVVVKQNAIEKMLSGSMLEFAIKNKFMFMDDETWDLVGLPRES